MTTTGAMAPGMGPGRPPRSQGGYLLAEVALAGALLALVLVPAGRLASAAWRLEREATQSLRMAHLAQTRMAELEGQVWLRQLPASGGGAAAADWAPATLPGFAEMEWMWGVTDGGRPGLFRAEVGVRCRPATRGCPPPVALVALLRRG